MFRSVLAMKESSLFSKDRHHEIMLLLYTCLQTFFDVDSTGIVDSNSFNSVLFL